MRFSRKIFSRYAVYSGIVPAAGAVFYAEDTKRICLAKRGAEVLEPHTWSTWGGKAEAGETPEEAVKREVAEEAGFRGEASYHLFSTVNGKVLVYSSFVAVVKAEFEPRLNWENEAYLWCDLDKLPSPLHPEFAKTLAALRQKISELGAL